MVKFENLLPNSSRRTIYKKWHCKFDTFFIDAENILGKNGF